MIFAHHANVVNSVAYFEHECCGGAHKRCAASTPNQFAVLFNFYLLCDDSANWRQRLILALGICIRDVLSEEQVQEIQQCIRSKTDQVRKGFMAADPRNTGSTRTPCAIPSTHKPLPCQAVSRKPRFGKCSTLPPGSHTRRLGSR